MKILYLVFFVMFLLSMEKPNIFHRHDVYMPPVFDQGQQGSCVAFALTTAMDVEILRNNGDRYYDQGKNMVSPAFLFNLTVQGDDCDASDLRDEFYVAKFLGAPLWNDMPYRPYDCSRLPTFALKFKAMDHRVKRIRKLLPCDSSSIVKALDSNKVLIITFYPDESFYRLRYDQIYNHIEYPISYLRHVMVVFGYDDDKHAYHVRNSWGLGWCHNGQGWIDYDFLTNWIEGVYEIYM